MRRYTGPYVETQSLGNEASLDIDADDSAFAKLMTVP